METALNSVLSFIKHVDCDRVLSEEAHKVFITKQKSCRFSCWLLKWELCYLANIERQMVAVIFFVNRFL